MAEREFYRYRLYESTKKEQKALKQLVLTTINRFKSINCQFLVESWVAPYLFLDEKLANSHINTLPSNAAAVITEKAARLLGA